MQDGLLQSSCEYCWIGTGTGPGENEYLQYTWPSARTLWGMWIDTEPGTGSECPATMERTLAGGDVQWWSGSSWITDGTVTGQADDWVWQFTEPVTTTAIRIYDAYSSPSINAVVFEWEVYACP
jgi:hypothetical protein